MTCCRDSAAGTTETVTRTATGCCAESSSTRDTATDGCCATSSGA
jgi:hypothetical protein